MFPKWGGFRRRKDQAGGKASNKRGHPAIPAASSDEVNLLVYSPRTQPSDATNTVSVVQNPPQFAQPQRTEGPSEETYQHDAVSEGSSDDGVVDDESTPVYFSMEETLHLGILDEIDRQIAIFSDEEDIDDHLHFEDFIRDERIVGIESDVEETDRITNQTDLTAENYLVRPPEEGDSQSEMTSTNIIQPLSDLVCESTSLKMQDTEENNVCNILDSPKTVDVEQTPEKSVVVCNVLDSPKTVDVEQTAEKSVGSELQDENQPNQAHHSANSEELVLHEDSSQDDSSSTCQEEQDQKWTPSSVPEDDRELALLPDGEDMDGLQEHQIFWMNCLQENGVDLNGTPAFSKTRKSTPSTTSPISPKRLTSSPERPVEHAGSEEDEALSQSPETKVIFQAIELAPETELEDTLQASDTKETAESTQSGQSPSSSKLSYSPSLNESAALRPIRSPASGEEIKLVLTQTLSSHEDDCDDNLLMMGGALAGSYEHVFSEFGDPGKVSIKIATTSASPEDDDDDDDDDDEEEGSKKDFRPFVRREMEAKPCEAAKPSSLSCHADADIEPSSHREISSKLPDLKASTDVALIPDVEDDPVMLLRCSSSASENGAFLTDDADSDFGLEEQLILAIDSIPVSGSFNSEEENVPSPVASTNDSHEHEREIPTNIPVLKTESRLNALTTAEQGIELPGDRADETPQPITRISKLGLEGALEADEIPQSTTTTEADPEIARGADEKPQSTTTAEADPAITTEADETPQPTTTAAADPAITTEGKMSEDQVNVRVEDVVIPSPSEAPVSVPRVEPAEIQENPEETTEAPNTCENVWEESGHAANEHSKDVHVENPVVLVPNSQSATPCESADDDLQQAAPVGSQLTLDDSNPSHVPGETAPKGKEDSEDSAADPYAWAYEVWTRRGMLNKEIGTLCTTDFKNDCLDGCSEPRPGFVTPRGDERALDFEGAEDMTHRSVDGKPRDRLSLPTAARSQPTKKVGGRKSFANIMQMWRDKSDDRPNPHFLSPEQTNHEERALSGMRDLVRYTQPKALSPSEFSDHPDFSPRFPSFDNEFNFSEKTEKKVTHRRSTGSVEPRVEKGTSGVSKWRMTMAPKPLKEATAPVNAAQNAAHNSYQYLSHDASKASGRSGSSNLSQVFNDISDSQENRVVRGRGTPTQHEQLINITDRIIVSRDKADHEQHRKSFSRQNSHGSRGKKSPQNVEAGFLISPRNRSFSDFGNRRTSDSSEERPIARKSESSLVSNTGNQLSIHRQSSETRLRARAIAERRQREKNPSYSSRGGYDADEDVSDLNARAHFRKNRSPPKSRGDYKSVVRNFLNQAEEDHRQDQVRRGQHQENPRHSREPLYCQPLQKVDTDSWSAGGGESKNIPTEISVRNDQILEEHNYVTPRNTMVLHNGQKWNHSDTRSQNSGSRQSSEQSPWTMRMIANIETAPRPGRYSSGSSRIEQIDSFGDDSNFTFDGPYCECYVSHFSGNDDLIEFFLPQMGMACTCGRRPHGLLDPDQPTSLKNILRPWQVRFLASYGISRGDQLVKAQHRSAPALASALRQYRRRHNMTAFRTKSCGMAIQIWSKTCKAFVRSIRKQLVSGTDRLELPNTLNILSSFLDKIHAQNLMPHHEHGVLLEQAEV